MKIALVKTVVLSFLFLGLNTNFAFALREDTKLINTIDSLAQFKGEANQIKKFKGYIEEEPTNSCSVVMTSSYIIDDIYRDRLISIHVFPVENPTVEFNEGVSAQFEKPKNTKYDNDISFYLNIKPQDSTLYSTELDLVANIGVNDNNAFLHLIMLDGNPDKPESIMVLNDLRGQIYFKQDSLIKVKAANAQKKYEYTCVIGDKPVIEQKDKKDSSNEAIKKDQTTTTVKPKEVITTKARKSSGSLLAKNIRSPLSNPFLTQLVNDELRSWFGTKDINVIQLASTSYYNIIFTNLLSDRRNFYGPNTPYHHDEFIVDFQSGGLRYSCKMYDLYYYKKIIISNCNSARRFTWTNNGQRASNELNSIFLNKKPSSVPDDNFNRILSDWNQNFPDHKLNSALIDGRIINYDHVIITQ